MTLKGREPRQIDPTGKSIPIYGNRVKPRNEKYFAFPEGQIRAISNASRPDQRGARDRHDVGRGCGGRESCDRRARRTRTAKTCGPDAAVLASMHLEAIASQGATEAKEPFSGEITL